MPAQPKPPIGKTVPVDQLVYAVGEVETGGIQPISKRYTTVNSIGAHGRYQVMRANIPGWTKEVLGQSMTPAQFLASPKAQDKVAAYKLGASQKKYGDWRSAASVWFSGQPNWSSSASDGGNTVAQYVEKVRKFLGGGSVAGTGSADQTGILGDLGEGLLAPFTNMAKGVTSIAESLLNVGKFAEFLIKLALPSTWVRIVCGVLGAALLIFGLVVLGREARGM